MPNASHSPSSIVSHSAHILVAHCGDTTWTRTLCELRECGYRVSIATGRRAALGIIDAGRVDLVISVVEGAVNGDAALTQEIRRRSKVCDLPVIHVITSPDHRALSIELGADDFILAPIDSAELLQRVRLQLLRAERLAELLRATRVDPLTGLLNRTGIVDELQRELRRFNRTRAPLYVMMIDLDDFKSVNDIHGHLVGDQVLRSIATGLERSLRKTDRIGRLGGDEFLCVLPDCNGASSDRLVARILRRVHVQPEGAGAWVRLSVGGASANARESLEAVVRRADAAMYLDKRGAPSERLVRATS